MIRPRPISRRLSRSGAVAAFLLVAVIRSTGAQQRFLDPEFDVAVTTNIVYARGEVRAPEPGFVDLLLDLYTPVDAAAPPARPGFVLIHGGGFTGGTKNNGNMVQLAQAFAARGFVCVSINYRLVRDDPPTPGDNPTTRAVNAAIEDAANAVRWMRANAGSHRLDISRIAIGGSSAGAITSLFVAYMELDEAAEVHSVMDLWGGLYGFESLIDADDSPLFIVHGTNDQTVPFNLSEAIVDQATSVGLDFEFYPITGAGHGVSLVGTIVDGKSLFQRIVEFEFSRLDLDGLLNNAVPASEWRLYR